MLAVAAVGLFGIGLLAGFKRLPPTAQVMGAIGTVETAVARVRLDGPRYARWYYGKHEGELRWVEDIHPDAAKTDVASLITIRDLPDVAARRAAIQAIVWRGHGGRLPAARQPDAIDTDISDPRYAGLENLASIRRLTVRMDFGLTSVIYYLLPARPNGNLVIYHQGHRGDFVLGKETIAALVRDGYAVLGFAMPLKGMNADPSFDIPRFGHIRRFGHNMFYLAQTAENSPIRYFLEPIAAGLNYALADQSYRCVAMTGISGGGWLTTLYGALDPRICRNYPIAGGLPLYLRSLPPNDLTTNNRTDLVVGDFEEFQPEIFAIANNLELYAMGAAGPDRGVLQIFNKYDPVNYRGVVGRHFATEVTAAVAALGAGAFTQMIDDSLPEHEISDAAIARILADLATMPRS